MKDGTILTMCCDQVSFSSDHALSVVIPWCAQSRVQIQCVAIFDITWWEILIRPFLLTKLENAQCSKISSLGFSAHKIALGWPANTVMAIKTRSTSEQEKKKKTCRHYRSSFIQEDSSEHSSNPLSDKAEHGGNTERAKLVASTTKYSKDYAYCT